MSDDSRLYDDGLVQLDRAAITLRRYHFPSGTSKVIALDSDPRIQGRVVGPVHAAVPHLGQLRLPPLAAAGRATAHQVDVDHPGRTGNLAEPRVHAGRARTSSPRCWTSCSSQLG